jgi:uncharacterized protein (DUF1501 family)
MGTGFLGVANGSYKTTAIPKKGEPFEVRGLKVPESMTVEKVNRREELLAAFDQKLRQADANSAVLEGLDRFSKKANAMILSDKARIAFDTHRESPAITDLFEKDDASQSMLLACRLVEHGMRFVTVTHDRWDTHLDNFKNMKDYLLPEFDAGISSLILALEQKGLLEKTLVVACGEFGRTPTINKNAGRDHWPRAMWTLLAGGGVKANNLIGGTDSKGHGPDDATHIRPDDLAASIYEALGIDSKKEYHTRTGRPAILVPEGKPIEGLFA